MWYFFNSRYQGESAMAPQRQRNVLLPSYIMDAAIDAMLPYGFAKSHVRKIVKRLLKEYGGNEGWPFIEEFAYKQLIEAILRDLGASDETAAENVNPSQVELKEEDIAEPSCITEDSTFRGAELLYGPSNRTSQGVNKRGVKLGQSSRQDRRVTRSSTVRNNAGIPTAPVRRAQGSTSLNPPMGPVNKLPNGWMHSDEEEFEEKPFC